MLSFVISNLGRDYSQKTPSWHVVKESRFATASCAVPLSAGSGYRKTGVFLARPFSPNIEIVRTHARARYCLLHRINTSATRLWPLPSA